MPGTGALGIEGRRRVRMSVILDKECISIIGVISQGGEECD